MALDLTKLAQRRAALEGKLAAATTALRDAQRRDDTRRRIVLGGALLAAVRDRVLPAGVLVTLVRRMTERDAALFADAAAVSGSELEGAGQ